MLWLLKKLLFIRTINIYGLEIMGNDLHLHKKSPINLFFLNSDPAREFTQLLCKVTWNLKCNAIGAENDDNG